jgi:predicted nucleic acid-binding protein/plastocyanin
MNRLMLVLLLLVLLPVVIAQSDVANMMQEVGFELQGTKVPAPLNKIFGDERVNVHIEIGDETVIMALITKKGVVDQIAAAEVKNPTLNVYTSESALAKIMMSSNQLSALKRAIDNGDVRYKAVGFVQKVKFFFVNFLLKVTGGLDSEDAEDFRDDEIADFFRTVEAEGLEDEEPSDSSEDSGDDEVIEDLPLEVISGPTTHEVLLNNEGFAETDIEINVGDTVVWKNGRTGSVKKALIIGTKKCRAAKSKVYNPGEQYSYTFTEPQLCVIAGGIFTKSEMKIRVS